MKIACLADLHWKLPILPKVDLCLIAGDLSYANYQDTKAETEWLMGPFTDWLNSHKIPTIVTPGNHDFAFQHGFNYFKHKVPCTTLMNGFCQFRGVHIFGTPYTLEYYDWAFQATEPQHESYGKPNLIDLNDIFDMPECSVSDIWLSHGPPMGFGDWSNGSRCGSHALRSAIDAYNPKLVLCGHIHTGYGIYQIGETCLINCAYSDPGYHARNEIIVVDYDEVNNKVIGSEIINEG